ncbi:hypothetical protein WG66_006120 [Moniliophthora roreri]|nr:hypothetical protein WG66_006120 [Moniliophthora roreri]
MVRFKLELTYRPSLINEVANFTNGVVHVARTTSRRLAIGPYFWRTNANARIGERCERLNVRCDDIEVRNYQHQRQIVPRKKSTCAYDNEDYIFDHDRNQTYQPSVIRTFLPNSCFSLRHSVEFERTPKQTRPSPDLAKGFDSK